MKKITFLATALSLVFTWSCNSANQPSEETETNTHESAEISTSIEIKEGQSVNFPNLVDGQEITLPFVVEFGVAGMEVEPAGLVVADKGHHHLLVDSDPIEGGRMVPANETNVHFGGGQLSDTLQLSKYPTLTPGAHTLTLQFADGIHNSYGPKMSKTVNVIIK